MSSSDAGTLIPRLPDPVALHCFARVPRRLYPVLRCVCQSWNKLLSSNTHDVFSVREEIQFTEAWVYFSFSLRSSRSNIFMNFFLAFDPGANVWRKTSPIPGLNKCELIKGYSCVGLKGKLYVIGGKSCVKESSDDGNVVESDLKVRNEVYSYDCLGGKWRKCANMHHARVDFACSVWNGKIYVSGGRSRLDHERGMSSAEVYIPEHDLWQPLPNMSIARYKCVGVTLNNKVYVIGGYTSDTLHRSSVEIYDPVSKIWERDPKMWALDIPPYEVVELKGKLYRSGDQLNHWRGSIDVYDETLNMWKTMRGSRRKLGEDLGCSGMYVTMAGIGKYLLFFGGHCRRGHAPFCFETVDAFKAEAGLWSTVEPFQSTCRELCAPCCVVYA